MTEAVALTQEDITWLKQRAPVRIVDELIGDGEFVVIGDEDTGN